MGILLGSDDLAVVVAVGAGAEVAVAVALFDTLEDEAVAADVDGALGGASAVVVVVLALVALFVSGVELGVAAVGGSAVGVLEGESGLGVLVAALFSNSSDSMPGRLSTVPRWPGSSRGFR